MPTLDPISTDVLVVGGGPAGASVAIRLARSGHDVTLVEKRAVPRHKACGDALTPRAVAELARLDIDPLEFGGHSVHGVRMVSGRHDAEIPWPEHPDLPSHGVVLRRQLLDQHLRQLAHEAGARVLMGHEAVAPIAERGFVRGASMQVTTPEATSHDAGQDNAGKSTGDVTGQRDITARFMVVADGANSRFGRGLGTQRATNWPYGIATRTYFRSDRHSESWIESSLGLRDGNDNPIAGFGWVIPVGDGTINVGVGMLSSYRDIKGVNALKLLDSFSAQISTRWGFDASERLKAPTRFRVPLGGSVTPKMGPTFLVVGDAAGAANPFSGDGVDAALMGGRLAADVLDEALTTGNSTTLQRYPMLLSEELEAYLKVGRLTARFLGRPAVLSAALRVGSRSDAAMGAALRIASNELRSEGNAGNAERAYHLARVISRFAPSW